METFRNLTLAFQSMHDGGNRPCVMNAANEVAVDAFLKGKINFLDITGIIEDALSGVPFIKSPGIEDLFETDAQSRNYSQQTIEKLIYG